MRFVVQKTLDQPGYRLDVYDDESEWVSGTFEDSRGEVLRTISVVLRDAEAAELSAKLTENTDSILTEE